ncbi:hypothetical protein BDW74DRAFT_188518 [Aspergillus multicolor]|uniref:uncharacterized protein n=1 Tax=Aspergillus multicolor TaxID=41759 RepID=UPI003CCD92B8
MVRASRGCQSCVDAQLQVTPALRQRYQSTPSPSSSESQWPTETPERSLQKRQSGNVDLPLRRSSRSSPLAEYKPVPPLAMDDCINPSLSVNAIISQQAQIFTNYVLSSFPCFFRCTETRVPVNWVEYVDQRGGSMNSSFDWSVRACTAAYLGSLHDDSRYAMASQGLYHRALRALGQLLSSEESAKSDEVLGSAIVLAVFEKHNCSSPDAWLRHAAGIRTLMKLRGPKAHLQGFGRAMYIVYRNFLITAALVEGEACFLEEPEWQALNEEIAANDAKLPTSSLYTDVVERGFLSVIKIPGLVKRTRELQDQPVKKRADAHSALLQDVQATRAALRGIYTEFGVSVSMLRSGQDENDTFVGPVQNFFFEGFSSHFARGVRLGLLILNYLIAIMDPKQRATIDSENFILLSDMTRSQRSTHPTSNFKLPLTPPESPGRPSLVVRSLITEELREPPTTDWMDRITSTMGLEAVHVSLIG